MRPVCITHLGSVDFAVCCVTGIVGSKEEIHPVRIVFQYLPAAFIQNYALLHRAVRVGGARRRPDILYVRADFFDEIISGAVAPEIEQSKKRGVVLSVILVHHFLAGCAARPTERAAARWSVAVPFAFFPWRRLGLAGFVSPVHSARALINPEFAPGVIDADEAFPVVVRDASHIEVVICAFGIDIDVRRAIGYHDAPAAGTGNATPDIHAAAADVNVVRQQVLGVGIVVHRHGVVIHLGLAVPYHPAFPDTVEFVAQHIIIGKPLPIQSIVSRRHIVVGDLVHVSRIAALDQSVNVYVLRGDGDVATGDNALAFGLVCVLHLAVGESGYGLQPIPILVIRFEKLAATCAIRLAEIGGDRFLDLCRRRFVKHVFGNRVTAHVHKCLRLREIDCTCIRIYGDRFPIHRPGDANIGSPVGDVDRAGQIVHASVDGNIGS